MQRLHRLFILSESSLNIPDIDVGFDISQKRQFRLIHFPFRWRLREGDIHETERISLTEQSIEGKHLYLFTVESHKWVSQSWS